MARSDDYISEVRTLNKQVWDGINGLLALQEEWNASNYGATLSTGTGNNAGIDSATVGAVVFDSANALRTVQATGVATNMAKLL